MEMVLTKLQISIIIYMYPYKNKRKEVHTMIKDFLYNVFAKRLEKRRQEVNKLKWEKAQKEFELNKLKRDRQQE